MREWEIQGADVSSRRTGIMDRWDRGSAKNFSEILGKFQRSESPPLATHRCNVSVDIERLRVVSSQLASSARRNCPRYHEPCNDELPRILIPRTSGNRVASDTPRAEDKRVIQ